MNLLIYVVKVQYVSLYICTYIIIITFVHYV